MRTLSGAITFEGIDNPISVKPFVALIIIELVYFATMMFLTRKLPRALQQLIIVSGAILIIAAWFYYMFFK